MPEWGGGLSLQAKALHICWWPCCPQSLVSVSLCMSANFSPNTGGTVELGKRVSLFYESENGILYKHLESAHIEKDICVIKMTQLMVSSL